MLRAKPEAPSFHYGVARISVLWQLLMSHGADDARHSHETAYRRSAEPFIEIVRPSLPDDELRQGAACQAGGS